LSLSVEEDVFQFLKQFVQTNGWIDLPAHGTSMFPMIRQGSVCRFVPTHVRSIKRGDVLLFRSGTGQLIAHRLYQVVKADEGTLYICKGDSNLGTDRPIHYQQIIGILSSIRLPSGRTIPVNGLFNRLWAKIIIDIPYVSPIIRKYISMKHAKHTTGATL